ncbi:uncharacterized transmembrane protein DDB_G0289901 [Drosophila montana]|uniref:uncharacterized transmembrane protein DDB_G0289901 n=1 Tax=Drosophila montana TaxID=40370 RepID=UPI00313C4004
MWRVHLFLLLSTCFFIPYDAKPATGSLTSASALSEARRSSHIGRLAAKDLADLLLASMQARGIKLTESQHSTIKSLRDMETSERQGGAVLLQVGMDVIIDVLIGSNADASCERVIKDIKKSSDKNSLTLGLKSFLALCAFNNIDCSQKQVVQIIKSTTSAKQSETAIEGTRITRTALEQAGKSANIKGDRDSIVSFLQARSVPELSAILNTLLQVCGASSVEAQNIVQNLIEMGPKDGTGVNVLQINGFSTLIVSLMDSLTSIANGNKSGFCAATPESWIVRLLDMGVAKVIIMGLMTALDRSLPTSPNALIQQGNAVANLVDADVSKSSPTSKRASGSLPVIGNLLGNGIASGPTNVANRGGNTITTGPKNVISGSDNTILSAVDANVLAGVGVNALNSITGVVGGSNGSGGSSTSSNSGSGAGMARSQNIANQLGNNIALGPKNVVSGSGNTIASLVDAQVPVGADVNVLSNALGTVTGGSGSSGGSGGVAGGLLGGGSGSSRSQSTANRFGNEISTGPRNIVNGSGNTIASLVDAQVPVGADVNVLSNALGTVTGGSGSSGGSGGVAGGLLGGGSGSSRSQSTANRFGNEISTGPRNIVNGSGNTIASLVDAQVPVGADVNVLSGALGTVTGGSGGSGGSGGGLLGGATGGLLGGGSGSSRSQNNANRFGNEISTGPRNIVDGSGNTIASLVGAQIPVGADVNVLSGALGTVTGGSGDSGSSGGATGGLLGGGSGSSRSQSTANRFGNEISTGPRNIVNGSGNTIASLVDAQVPVGADVNILSGALGTVTGGSGSSGGSGGVAGGLLGGATGGLLGGGSGSSRSQNTANRSGNEISTGPRNIVNGSGNTIASLVDAQVPVGADVNVLSNALGTVTGGSGSSGGSGGVAGGLLGGGSGSSRSQSTANRFGNEISTGPRNIVNGSGNTIASLVDAQVPVGADVNVLSNALGTVTGGSGSSGGSGGVAGGLLGGATGGLLGGGSGSSRSQNIANKGGNTITRYIRLHYCLVAGPKNAINGSNNSILKAVDLDLPVGLGVNLLQSTVGMVSGSSSGSGGVLGGATGGLLGGLTGAGSGSSQGQNIANMGGNQISTGQKNIVSGNGNSILSLVDATVPVGLAINALSSAVGSVSGGGAARNDVVQVVDQQGNRLMDIWDKDGVTAGSGGIGNDLSNTVNRGPKQIVMGDDNNIVKLVNLDASVLARLDLANSIRGSSGACNGIGNELNSGPENIIEGNRNTLVTLVDLNLDVLANLNLLNNIIGTVGNDCQVTTPSPPTPSPPTPSPPTPSPPTPSPPTPSPPTPQPPTPSPPTPSPPTPSPNNCYRRYCRKWRTRPSYLCYKNCGGSYVYRP